MLPTVHFRTPDCPLAQKAKDQARQNRIQQLFNYWYYYYQLRSIALWDFERGCELTADVERLIEH